MIQFKKTKNKGLQLWRDCCILRWPCCLCGRFGLPFVLHLEKTVAWDLLQKEILEKMKYFLRPTVSIQVCKHFAIPVEHAFYSEAAFSTLKLALLGLTASCYCRRPLELLCILSWCLSSTTGIWSAWDDIELLSVNFKNYCPKVSIKDHFSVQWKQWNT